MNPRTITLNPAKAITVLSLAVAATAALAQDSGSAEGSSAPQSSGQEQTASAVAEAPAQAPVEPVEITDRSHPEYVRCRREAVIGSRAQRRRICMTNREWAAIANEGNRRTNELVDEMRSTSVPNN